MKILVSTTVTAAVLATALVSVRLHHEVMRHRYRLGELERERTRVDRDLRLATAEFEEAKSPRRLLDRLASRQGLAGETAPERIPSTTPTPPPEPDALGPEDDR